jgi:hypothetical protein
LHLDIPVDVSNTDFNITDFNITVILNPINDSQQQNQPKGKG